MAGLFRFSNAVSDISKFIQTYRELYKNFSSLQQQGKFFDHDDASTFLALSGLASSQGAIGYTAIKRSRRPDRSRDPLYNQHKMYSEMYRMLGWYEPGTKQTNFRMTEYGEYIFESKQNSDEERNLFSLNLLHIASPNAMTEIKGMNVLRPFPMILKLMNRLGGCICRDEIIIGVLACSNDREQGVIENITNKILDIRKIGKKELDRKITELNIENGYTTPATSQNYTRFPIAAMKWIGWAEGCNLKGIYGNKSIAFLRLTEQGKKLAERIEDSIDIRMNDLKNFSQEEQACFVIWSNLHQLEELGYNLSDYSSAKKILKTKAEKIFEMYNIKDNSSLLFFGYQEAPRYLLEIGDKILNEL